MRWTLVVGLALAGCGGDDDWAKPIDGTWLRAISSTCAVGLNIDAAGRAYNIHMLCKLAGSVNDFGDAAEFGTLELAVKQVRFTPTRVSCTEEDHAPRTFDYTVSGDTLTLQTEQGVVQFKRGKPSETGGGTGAGLAYGCWYDDGTFVPHELVSL